MTLLIDLSNPAHAAVVLFALIVLMVFSHCAGNRCQSNGDEDPIESVWIIALVVCFCGLLSCIVNLIWKAL